MNRLRIVLATALAVAGISIAAHPAYAVTPPSKSGAAITAIYFDSPGSDNRTNASLNAEFVRIANKTRKTLTLTGWTLRDAGSKHVYKLGAFRLAAGTSFTVHTGKGRNTAHTRFWGLGSYVWNNTGDKATLRNAHGTTVDTCGYTKKNDPRVLC